MADRNAGLDVFVVRVGRPRWADYTVPFIRDYCRTHRYRLHWLMEHPEWAKDRSPSWCKLLAHRFVNSDFILVMDLDIVPVPGAPPILPELDPSCLNAVTVRNTWRRRRALKKYGMDAGLNYRYNTGLLGVPRSAAPALERLYHASDPKATVGYEQEYFNRWVWADGVPVRRLEVAWNADAGRRFGSSSLDGRWHFVHLAGRLHLREARARYCWEHFRGGEPPPEPDPPMVIRETF